MQTYISRQLNEKIKKKLENSPAVAVLGPRQSGKSTLAKKLLSSFPDSVYLDLERPSDLNKLRYPEAFFEINQGKLICLDEIQRSPELFPILRSVLDDQEKNGQLLITGSASRDLLQQSSESLAGRIAYLELTPFQAVEIPSPFQARDLWLKGGFPRSFLQEDFQESLEWRKDFIRTYLERDIPRLGIQIPPKNIERFWQMCAHVHGQVLNASKLGASLGISHHTIKRYIEILEQTFLLRILPPFESNLKKRLIKSPKIYLRDSGILHALLEVATHNDLLGHPAYGESWEGFVLENICSSFPSWVPSFYRTSSGSEIDLILTKGQKKVAVEVKVSSSPTVTKGFWNALEDLKITDAWIIAQVKESYPLDKKVKTAPLKEFLTYLQSQ